MKGLFLIPICLLLLFSNRVEAETKAKIKTKFGTITVKLYDETPKHRDRFIKESNMGNYDGTLFYRVIENFLVQGGARASKNAAKGERIGYGKPDFTVDDEVRSQLFHKRGALCAPRQPDEENPFNQSDISQFYIVTGKVYSQGELDTLELINNIPIKKVIKKRIFTPQSVAKLKELRAAKKVKEHNELLRALKLDLETELRADPKSLFFSKEQRDKYTTVGGYPQLDGKYTVFGEVISGMEVIQKISKLRCDKNSRPFEDIKITLDIIK